MKGSSLLPPIARRLEGKVALITGGASGIGSSAARLFAKHGAKVVIADIQETIGRSVCNDIGFDHGVVSYVHCDVTNEAEVEKTVNTVIDKYGKLDIMLSNAGNGGTVDSRLISMVDYNQYKRVFDVNVFGAFAAAKHAARVMIPARVGSILFTSNTASAVTYGNSNPHPYLASKDVVAGLAKNLGIELGQYGITVNCISPFALASPLLLLRSLARNNKLGKVEQLISMGEILEAKDMAHAEPIWG